MVNKSTTQSQFEQGRAQYAYECAEQGKEILQCVELEKDKFYADKKYSSYTKRFLTYVKTNGLGAALAFYYSKRTKNKDKKPAGTKDNPYNAYDLICNQLGSWLNDERCPVSAFIKQATGENILEKIISCNSNKYRAITVEVLVFMNWVKRFAEGLIKEEEEVSADA